MKEIWRIIRTTKSLWRYYIVISFFTVGLAVLNLLQPMFTGWAIDEIRKGTGANIHQVVLIGLAIFAADFGANIFSNISGYYGDRMAASVRHILSMRYYEHLLSLPQRYFDTELTGKIINRLSRSINQISSFMNMLSNNFLQFIFSTVIAIGIVVFYSWQVAAMLAALYPIYFGLTVHTSSKWKKYQSKKNHMLDVASGRFAESVGQVRVVKSYNQERRELSFFRGYMDRFVQLTKPQAGYWHRWDIVRRVALNVIFLGVYLYIFVQAAHGHFTPGEAVALILYAMQIRTPLFTISFLVNHTQRAIADSKDYFDIMAVEPEITDKPGAKPLKVSNGEVVFKDVSFGYSDDHMVIKNIDLLFKANTKVALVGESGEGKTTITTLLMRLYEPQKGQVTIDGQDTADVTQASLREAIGTVFQDPALFSGTIRENISYANPKADEEQLISAAKAANAHEFISKFDDGYDTQIGERGLKLSGGQKQRIAIARALLKDAPILVLDEATSSLDSKSEHMVQLALARLMKNRTTIIIAHRLSTIQHVDTIVTLKNGHIDEIGTPKHLAKSGGIYAQLLDMQSHVTAATEEEIRKDLEKFDISGE